MFGSGVVVVVLQLLIVSSTTPTPPMPASVTILGIFSIPNVSISAATADLEPERWVLLDSHVFGLSSCFYFFPAFGVGIEYGV